MARRDDRLAHISVRSPPAHVDGEEACHDPKVGDHITVDGKSFPGPEELYEAVLSD